MSSIAFASVCRTSRYASAGTSTCTGLASPADTSPKDLPISTSIIFFGFISGIA